MALHLPTSDDVRQRLAAMTHAELTQLAKDCKVPFTTLWKIRDGTTKDTRLDTLRKFWPTVERRKAVRAD